MHVADAIHQRRSIKRFTAAPVSREQIDALLAAAVLAPKPSLDRAVAILRPGT